MATQSESKSPSRRALLAGALGGIGAWVGSAINRAAPVRANGEAMTVGTFYTTATTTGGLRNLTNSAAVFYVDSFANGVGTGGGVAISGLSHSSIGVSGYSATYVGVLGTSSASDKAAVAGGGSSSGVLGYSPGGGMPAAKPKTGVYGTYTIDDAASKGVWGHSSAGHGIHGQSSSGWAGYFDGRVLTKKYHELVEIGTPSAPGSNHARLFIRDNGSGKTQLCVRFHTGAVKVLATQP
jgi:hypothetical protein